MLSGAKHRWMDFTLSAGADVPLLCKQGNNRVRSTLCLIGIASRLFEQHHFARLGKFIGTKLIEVNA